MSDDHKLESCAGCLFADLVTVTNGVYCKRGDVTGPHAMDHRCDHLQLSLQCRSVRAAERANELRERTADALEKLVSTQSHAAAYGAIAASCTLIMAAGRQLREGEHMALVNEIARGVSEAIGETPKSADEADS